MPNDTSTVIKTTEYVLTADEQVQIWREAMVRWADYIFAVAVFGGTFTFILWAALLSNGPISIWGIVFGSLFSLPLILGIAYPYLRAKGIRRQTAALEAAGKVVAQRHEFDGRFITTYLSDGQESRLALNDFKMYVVTNDMLYLYVAKKNYWPIPMRAFDESTKMENLFAMLKANGVELRRSHPKGGWTS